MPPSRVVIVGDSLSDEARGGGGFVKLLRARCPKVEFHNLAKGGFMVNQMRRRLEQELLLAPAARYSHAIVFGGVNDLYSDLTAQRSLARIQSDLSRIYTLLNGTGAQVIGVTVTPWGGFTKYHTPARSQNTLTLNAWIIEQQRQGKLSAAIDAYPLLSCGAPEQLCPELAAPFKDGLHFGKLGHARLAEALYGAVFSGCER